MALSGPKDTKGDERHSRILSAALEVFSKSSFAAATTQEIARRAHVSKRDLYAAFPDKHAILIEVIETVLENGEANLRRTVADNLKTLKPNHVTLEIVGLALLNEILSPLEGFVCRLAFAESAAHPLVGKKYFESWFTRRGQIVAQALSSCIERGKGQARQSYDKHQASKQFLALITHLPQLTVCLGLTGMWTPKSIQAHVKNSVATFITIYPVFK
jgi:AcrR family transcriptional regulator